MALPGSSPTRIVANPGGRPLMRANASASSATSARTRAATALPSITRAAMRRRRLSSVQTLANDSANADEVHVGRRAALMLLAFVALAAPAIAHARVVIGIGDQKPE